jgi:putative two-component system response regulator
MSRNLNVTDKTTGNSINESGPHAWRDLLRPMRLMAAGLDGAGDDNPITEAEHTLFALAKAVEQRDPHTANHCERLSYIGVSMGIYMGLDRAGLLALYRGGYLHDVGKVGIPDSILFKPGRLTEEEWVVMRTHPVRGVQICQHLRSLGSVLPIIRHHHERWDGSGYPDGLRGEEIPLTARIMQIADIYDALTSPRSYKVGYSPENALALIGEETKRGWCDPELVKLFFAMHKDVIAKAELYANGDRSLEAMCDALCRLQLVS